MIIVTGICFVIGNVMWDKFGLYEPKFFYIPLSLFMCFMLYEIRERAIKQSMVTKLLLNYLLVLSAGNVVKQVFYSDAMKQINDYWLGGLVSLTFLILIIKWAITKRHSGKK